jgi:clan AA aspartic protease
MGLTYAEVLLTNAIDISNARLYIIGEEEIRRIVSTMLVDSGADMLCINENIQTILGLPFIEKRRCQLAEGFSPPLDIVGPVQLRFKNRITSCNAIVLTGDAEPLLGAIPLEEMDLLIDPLKGELIINPEHPEHAVLRI